MPFIRRELNTRISEEVLTEIKKAGIQFSIEEAEAISAALSEAEHTNVVSVLPALSDTFRADEFNRFFHLLNIDNTIMMEDIRILFDSFRHLIKTLLSENYVLPRVKVRNAISKIKNFIRLLDLQQSFNLVQSINPAYETDYSVDNRTRLYQDKAAGVVRLQSASGLEFASLATLKVATVPLSTGLMLIMTDPMKYLFDEDLNWHALFLLGQSGKFTSGQTRTDPLVALDLYLPATVPVNSVSVRFLSDVLHEITRVEYAPAPGALLRSVQSLAIDNFGISTSVSFKTVYARQIRLVIALKNYADVKEKATIDTGIKDNFLESLYQECLQIRADATNYGITETEIKDRLIRAIRRIPVPLRPGSKVYVLSLRSVGVHYRQYRRHGTYQTKFNKINGNLYYITLQAEARTTENTKLLYKLVLPDQKEYSIGQVNEQGRIEDTLVVRTGDIEDSTKRYYVETSFIPDESQPIIFKLGNTDITSAMSSSVPIRLPNGNRYFVDTSLPSLAGISEGMVIKAEYYPAQYDRNGTAYDPRFLNLIEILGKPNVVKRAIANRSCNKVYLYTNTTPQKLVMYDYEEITVKEKELVIPVLPSGQLLHYVDPTELSNLTMKTTTLPNGNVRGTAVYTGQFFGPWIGIYAFIEEELTVAGTANTRYILTSYPFAKGGIIVEFNGVRVPIVREYSSNARVGSPSGHFNFCQIDTSIPLNARVNVVYMPIPASNGAYPSQTRSNIDRQNEMEVRYFSEPVTEFELKRYPFIDPEVVKTDKFVFSEGVWYYKALTSIYYQPFSLTAAGRPLKYKTDFDVIGRKVRFMREVTGQVVIRYYSLCDSYSIKVEGISADPSVSDETPVLRSMLVLAKVFR